MLQGISTQTRSIDENEPLLPRSRAQHVRSNSATSRFGVSAVNTSREAVAYLRGMYAQSMHALNPSVAALEALQEPGASPLNCHFACRKDATLAMSLNLIANLFNEGRNYAIPLMGSRVGLMLVTALPFAQTWVNAEAGAATARWAGACAVDLNNRVAEMVAKSAVVSPGTMQRSIIPNKLVQMQRIQKEHCETLAQLTAPVATLLAAAISLLSARGAFLLPLAGAFITQWVVEELAVNRLRSRLSERVAQSRVAVNNHLLEMPDALHDGVDAWQAYASQHEALQRTRAAAESWLERSSLLTGAVGVGLMVNLYLFMGWFAPVEWDENRRTTIATAVTAGTRLSFILQPMCKQRSIWSTNVAHSDALVDEVREARELHRHPVSWDDLTVAGPADTSQGFLEALRSKTPGRWRVSGDRVHGEHLRSQLEMYRTATQESVRLHAPDSPSSAIFEVALGESLRSERMRFVRSPDAMSVRRASHEEPPDFVLDGESVTDGSEPATI